MKKNQKIIILLTLLISSCGLIDKFKTPETNTESTENKEVTSAAMEDDLFSDVEAPKLTENKIQTDAPSNIQNVEAPTPELKDDLAEIQNEFSGSAPAESSIKVVDNELKNAKEEIEIRPDLAEAKIEMPKVVETKIPTKKVRPLKVREEAPKIENSFDEIASTDQISTYQVQKGETLMQIAFKLYGNISAWKDLRSLNGDKLPSNAALRAGLKLKYHVPEREFVWNPEGSPYLIRSGDTLGIISNNVYQTPRKWKSIWENNKPLIRNPNIIYAGFTIYYKTDGMANYVQPKKDQPKLVTKMIPINSPVEEIKIDNSLTEIERLNSTTEEISDIRASVVRAPASTEEDPDMPPPPITDEPMDDEDPNIN